VNSFFIKDFAVDAINNKILGIFIIYYHVLFLEELCYCFGINSFYFSYFSKSGFWEVFRNVDQPNGVARGKQHKQRHKNATTYWCM